MKALGLNKIGQTSHWVRLFVAVVALITMSQPAPGQLALPTARTGCGKPLITADAPAKAAGRAAFMESVSSRGMLFDGQETARLGFAPGPITAGVNAAGQT